MGNKFPGGKEVRASMRELLERSASIAVRFFTERITTETDVNNKPFKPRKNAAERPGRGILTQTGALRRGIKVGTVTSETAKIVSTVKYSKYHNEGTNRLPKRQFFGYGKQLDENIKKLIHKHIKKIFTS